MKLYIYFNDASERTKKTKMQWEKIVGGYFFLILQFNASNHIKLEDLSNTKLEKGSMNKDKSFLMILQITVISLFKIGGIGRFLGIL